MVYFVSDAAGNVAVGRIILLFPGEGTPSPINILAREVTIVSLWSNENSVASHKLNIGYIEGITYFGCDHERRYRFGSGTLHWGQLQGV
jgi:hypothetical protein